MLESVNKKNIYFIYFVLSLSALLVFGQVHDFDFINYDDDEYVYDNPHVLNGLTPNGIVWAFTTNQAGNWHPLTWLSLMLDGQLFGMDAGRMHSVNLLLHLANTLLLFSVLRKMTAALWPSAFVAAAFALHPMHVESVVWISERKDVLSTLFMLLALSAYLSYVRRSGWLRYLLVVLLFGAGLLAKPMLVTLPFLLLLLDYWPLNRLDLSPAVKFSSGRDGHRLRYRLVIEKIPFFALSAIVSAITFMVQNRSGAVSDVNIFPVHVRLANVVLSYVKYIGKFFWPENLGIFYPFEPDEFTFWRAALCILLLSVISVFVISHRSSHKYLLVGWFWFLGTLVPVIGLVQVGNQAYADRYTYIPYIGLLIMAAWGIPDLLSKWPHRRIILCSLMVVILTVLGIDAFWQAGYWRNGILLYTRTIEVTKDNYVAYNNLGNHYCQLGRYQEARESINHALKIKPRFSKAINNLGIINANLGRLQEAMENFKQAIQIRPGDADPYNNLGNVYDQLGLRQEAIEHFNRALKINPQYFRAFNNLGITYANLGRWQEAIMNFKQAIQIKPDYTEAYNNLGDAYGKAGRWQEAVETFKEVIEKRPHSAQAYTNLGIVYSRIGREQEAIEVHKMAIQIKPDYAEAYNNLGAVYNDLGRWQEASDAFKLAVQINPNCVQAYMNLGMLYSWLGRRQEAIEAYQRVIQITPENAEAYSNLAHELHLDGQCDQALEKFRAALRLRSDWPVVMNNIALLIAANPGIRNRDVNEAIRLASRACELTKNENPVFLGTLAAAYAAGGKFTEAVDTARMALKLADAANQPQIRKVIESHLSLYEQGKPYIEAPLNSVPDSGK